MITVYAHCKVADKNVDKFIDIANELITKTREESGCMSYELIRGMAEKNLFAFLEKWADRDKLDAHMKTIHFTTIVPQLGTLMEREMEIAVHDVII